MPGLLFVEQNFWSCTGCDFCGFVPYNHSRQIADGELCVGCGQCSTGIERDKSERREGIINREAPHQFSTPTSPVLILPSCMSWASNPEASLHKGMLVKRAFKNSGRRFQDLVDAVEVNLFAGKAETDQRDVGHISMDMKGILPDKCAQVDAEALARFEGASARLVKTLAKFPHPEARVLAEIVKTDANEMAQAIFLMQSEEVQRMVMRLHLVNGVNGCSRWHTDNYVGRAIVTYNGEGTQYQPDNNVNWVKFRERGRTNPQAVIAPRRTGRTQAGDLFFIRGDQSDAGGLVHAAPPVEYRDDGSARSRLVLKVDIPVEVFQISKLSRP